MHRSYPRGTEASLGTTIVPIRLNQIATVQMGIALDAPVGDLAVGS